MRGSFRIGKIAGIEIGIHYTWIFAFGLFAWSFGGVTFPALFPGWSTATYWIAGVIVSLGIFISVLIHELCHSLVAISRGMKVSSIVFFIFGGVSNIEKEPETAWVEFIMSGAGPASSLVLGGIFYAIALASARSGQTGTPLYAVLYYMFYINIVLAIFNIIPGFPLDGGRVFRSIVWGITKSLRKATIIAGNVGRGFGWAMILFGIALLFSPNGIWIFAGGLISGIWLVFIGWFLTSAADNAMREQTMQEQLAGVHVKDVMDRFPECVNPNAPVSVVVHESFIQRGRRALPICEQSGQIMGIVTLADVKKLPQDRWESTPVREIMTNSPLESVNETDDLSNALRVLASKGLNQIPVIGEGHLAGLLSRSDIIRYIQTKQDLGIKPGRPGGSRPGI
ncbi:MAG: Zn-dependent protease (includes SpoIVFB) [Chloroflexi bacterium]|nr:Zn-dependent protease (includes SpoIVFB) [Chloroflexota bacterium]